MQRLGSRLGRIAIALAGIAGITALCYQLLHATSTIAAIALLLGVLLTGAFSHTAEAVIASFAATLCLDYFFVPPIGSITIGDPQGWVALSVFLAVALLATNLSGRLRRQRDELLEREQESRRLYALNRAMLYSEGEDMRRLIVNQCVKLFDFEEAALVESATGALYCSPVQARAPEQLLRRTARGDVLSTDSSPDIESSWKVMPIVLGHQMLGSFGFNGAPVPETTLQVLANTIAVGLAQAQAQEAGSHAEAVRKSEELKSMMIDALAHDLKSPLTAIEAASEMLLRREGVDVQQRRDLLEVIEEEAKGLRRLVNEAIHLARIDANKLRLERQSSAVRELIESAIESLAERGASRQIKVEAPADLPFVLADRDLMIQAIKQLVDNAIKYSASRSHVLIRAYASGDFISIEVRDEGQGLTEVEQSRVFDKFYRGSHDRSTVQGSGMGLAITKEIVEAHGGSAAVESQVGQGSRFTIRLPAAVLPVAAGQAQL